MLILSIWGCMFQKWNESRIENNESDPETALIATGIYGVANFDDDDVNGSVDWFDNQVDLTENSDVISEEDDLALFTIPAEFIQKMSKTQSLELTQKSESIRVYQKKGENWKLIMNSTDDFFTIAKKEDVKDIVFGFEFSDYLQSGEFVLKLLDSSDGTVVYNWDISAYSSPLMVNHHLQPAEMAYSMLDSGTGGNQSFIDGFQKLTDSGTLTTFRLRDYQYDVWIQDEIEFSILNSPDSRIDVVIDSIRDRGLDDVPEDHLEVEDTFIATWGSGWATSQDAFGNLEASPPITVDGTEYPFGRAYYGRWDNERLHAEMRNLLDAQSYQAPVELDVRFLCVGHVDEYVSFVPDTSSPKGFKMLITDTNAGYDLLESISNFDLPQYRSSKGISDVNDILNDNSLRSLNREIQEDYIDPAVDIFTSEFGLDESDIIRIPMLFEEVTQCYGSTATLFPGVVNMLVFTNEDGTGADLFIPDPFFRSNISNGAEDPLRQAVEALMPSGNTVHWVDDWEWYHMALGEVHCGSNVRRAPSGKWWNHTSFFE